MKFRLLYVSVSLLILANLSACAVEDNRIFTGKRDTEDNETDSETLTVSDPTDKEAKCSENERSCADDVVIECDREGAWQEVDDCSLENEHCITGKCRNVTAECAAAMAQKSYIGCEYMAAPFSNSQLNSSDGLQLIEEPFHFAVAIANDNDAEVKVTITDGAGGEVDNIYNIPGGEMLVVEDLPWKKLLKEPFIDDILDERIHATRQVKNAAYYIKSDLPVTVYQFNPLHYQASAGGETVFSYTNDASLLLPTHVFLDEYIAIARPTMKISIVADQDEISSVSPGFLSIVGPVDGPTTVEIVTTAHTFASDVYSSVAHPAYAAGQTIERVTIQPFEVLQILSKEEPGCTSSKLCNEQMYIDDYGYIQTAEYYCCKSGEQYDLTGTSIRLIEGSPPAVFSGHNCTFVPYDRYACDHLEQQMFPLATWGTRYLCAHNITQTAQEPTVWRIVSGADDNVITLDVEDLPGTIILDKGEFIEFESKEDFEVVGTDRLAVAQFLVGQHYSTETMIPENGDPAMSLSVPVEQYRTSYIFLAPETYAHNYLTVIHLTGDFPKLDGQPIAGDTAEINEEYSRTNLEISGGIHSLSDDSPFGAMVYGVGSFTSYMYPAGLDLREVVLL